MKALSIRQPWAWAVLHAGKDIENRDWQTTNPALRFRGRCVVQAGAFPGVRVWNERWSEYCAAVLNFPREACPDPEPLIPLFDQLTFGALLGTVEVVEVVTNHPSHWFFGPVGLVLREPRPFPHPVPCKGELGFFDVPDRIIPAH